MSARHPVAEIFFTPRGHQACGGIFVRLVCGHVIVVPPGHQIHKIHLCYHCAGAARADALLLAYLPPR